jgi:t-SNARE complex subunit (syntaxin)
MAKHYKDHTTVKPALGQVNELPSKTVVGETHTIQELVQRYVRGMEVEQTQPNYVDVDDINSITNVFRKHLDLTDLDNFKRQVAGMQATLEANIAQAKQEQLVDTIKETNSKEEAPE